MLANNDDTSIYYETMGDPAAPAILFVNGLGSQLITYDVGFCQLFVEANMQVVRFDNRDVGLSSKTQGLPPDAARNMARFRSGDRVADPAYTLSDMAGDAFAVLDDLGLAKAHVAGMSMGAMICQHMALQQPDRVQTLTSIMSTTGAPGVGGADPADDAILVSPAPSERASFVAHTVDARRVNGGDHYSATYWEQMAGQCFDRSHHPAGAAFQVQAMAAESDRTEQLRSLSVPTLVIHGLQDRLIDPSGGRATAAAIAGSKLVEIASMGHDIPMPLWTQISQAIIEHTLNGSINSY